MKNDDSCWLIVFCIWGGWVSGVGWWVEWGDDGEKKESGVRRRVKIERENMLKG